MAGDRVVELRETGFRTILSVIGRRKPGGIVPTHSTRLTSFSSIVIAFTNAAARSDGVAFGLHTVLLASGPLAQSGKMSLLNAGTARSPAAPRSDATVFIAENVDSG